MSRYINGQAPISDPLAGVLLDVRSPDSLESTYLRVGDTHKVLSFFYITLRPTEIYFRSSFIILQESKAGFIQHRHSLCYLPVRKESILYFLVAFGHLLLKATFF